LLERFSLSKWSKASIYALSGGMAQRLMVARAIFHFPAVLFMDEPTAGLDPQSRLALWDLLVELNSAGQTVMLTTHYMEEADQLCNRVAIMDHGKILALDTPTNLKMSTGAETIVTIKVTSNAEHLAEGLKRDIDTIVSTRVQDNSLIIDMRRTERLVPRLVASAESNNVEILDLAVAEPTLETVFINLTGKELRDA
jgi:ABC-2 type transport system ATP-binding protein